MGLSTGIFRKAALFGAVLVGLMAAAPAQAITVSTAELATFTKIGGTDAGGTTMQGQLPAGSGYIRFTSLFETENGYATQQVGLTGLSWLFSAADNLVLAVQNRDGNSVWDFMLTVVTSTGGSATSTFTPVPVAAGTTSLLSVSLAGLTGVIERVYVTVAGIVPIDGEDPTAEYALAAVPVPAGVVLLGSALAGLGFLGRRNKSKQAVAA